MSNASKASTRGITKERLRKVSNHLTDAGVLLGEVYRVYNQHHSDFAPAFKQLIKMITMVEAMVIDIRDRL